MPAEDVIDEPLVDAALSPELPLPAVAAPGFVDHPRKLKHIRQAKILRRQAVVAKLYLTGQFTSAGICRVLRELGYETATTGLVGNDLRYLKRAWTEQARQTMAEWVTRELAKLDQLETELLLALGEGEDRVSVVDSMLKLMNRRASLLGLDAARRVELSGPRGGPLQLADVTDLTDAELERIAAGRQQLGPGPVPPALVAGESSAVPEAR